MSNKFYLSRLQYHAQLLLMHILPHNLKYKIYGKTNKYSFEHHAFLSFILQIALQISHMWNNQMILLTLKFSIFGTPTWIYFLLNYRILHLQIYLEISYFQIYTLASNFKMNIQIFHFQNDLEIHEPIFSFFSLSPN